MAKRRPAASTDLTPPDCPACGKHDETAHLDCYTWVCRRCEVRFASGKSWVSGMMFVSYQDAKSYHEVKKGGN